MSTDTAPVVRNPDTQAIESVIETLPLVVEESKKGYKTTEFWLTLVGLAIVNLNGVILTLPDKYQAIASALIAGFYAVSRGIAKNGVPVVAPSDPPAK